MSQLVLHTLPDIGSRLRLERRARARTVEDVAEAIGITRSGLTKIESGASHPSVPTLQRLAAELGIPVGKLFGDGAAPSRWSVVRACERASIEDGAGVRFERLTCPKERVAQLFNVTYPPGTATSASPWPADGGRARGVLVSGRLLLTVDRQSYELAAGDAVSFDPGLPHRIEALGDRPAEAIWAVIGR